MQQPMPELKELQLPDILSGYALLIDRQSGQILYEKNSLDRIYPASMTKLMTAIIALEEIDDYDETFTFTEEVLEGLEEANANRAGFLPGDSPTLLDLIYGDILPSGADCSRALAFYICGSEENFVEMMNEKARDLGMEDTHFVNTSGLFEPEHYSTCRDIAVLMDYCMNNPMFVEIIGTLRHVTIPTKYFPYGLNMDSLVMNYINQPGEGRWKHMFQIPGFIGGKSGYILESSFSMVSAAERGGMEMILVTCNGYLDGLYPVHVEDAARLYGWAVKNYRPTTILEPHVFDVELPVRGSSQTVFKGEVTDTVVRDAGEVRTWFIAEEDLHAPVLKGTQIGVLKVYSDDILMAESNVILAEDIIKDSWDNPLDDIIECCGERLWIVSLCLLGIAVLLIVMIARPKKRKRKKHRADF